MGLKKRGLLTFGILFLFVILSVIVFTDFSSAGHCSDDQTIFKMSSGSNAHGETWNGGSYSTRVCYDDFWTAYTGSSPHSCTGGNAVIGLSGSTNAHASSDGSYSDVCYGDLNCIARTGSCTGDEQLIISLSGSTNAHLGVSGTNICCTATGSGGEILDCTLNSATWSVASTTEGTTVGLNVGTSNCEGKTVSFVVWEDDISGDDPVVTNPSSVVVSGGSASGSWVAEFQEDASGNPEYYFIATLVSTGDFLKSNELEVSESGSPPPPPPSSNCSLTSASWSLSGEVVERTVVDMIITGTGCGGKAINFEIWENDPFIDDNVTIISGNFDSPVESWTTTWTYAGDDDSGNDPRDYYFKAVVVGASGESEQSSTLAVSIFPSVYCNLVTLCSNYYSGEGYTAENACNADICDVSEFSAEEFIGDNSFCENGDIDCFCEYVSGGICKATWEVSGDSHAECINNQCVEVAGDGVSECGILGSACTLPPTSHAVCVGQACMLAEGPGSNECSTSVDCASESPAHAECISSMCVEVAGDGVNECGVLNWGCALPSDSHAICLTNMCALKEGAGSNECTGGINCPASSSTGKCVYTETTTGSCEEDGFLSSSWTATWTGSASSRSASCVDGARVIECPAQIQLGFFNFYNVLITVLVIAGLYWVISIKKKGKGVKKGKSK